MEGYNVQKAFVFQVVLSSVSEREAEESLEELERLAETAGMVVIGKGRQRRGKPDPAFYIGKGKALELKAMAEGADLILFDNDLSPAQVKNLEDLLDLRVMDRTEVVLEIFTRRARTAEAKIQSELARLEYLLPRLVGKGHMLSQIGAVSTVSGRSGTRGPGETKLETLRRHIASRITYLRRELKRIDRRREVERRGRKGVIRVALVGYTNVGKSTIFNMISGANVYVDDKLFSTLDPTVRSVELQSGRKVVISDTVGFIRNLPPRLIAAFRSTLQEVVDSDIIVHIADASDPALEDHMEIIEKTLEDLGALEIPSILVLNKIDRVDRDRLEYLKDIYRNAVFTSAKEGIGIEELLRRIDDMVDRFSIPISLSIPEWDGKTISRLYEVGKILEKHVEDGRIFIKAMVPSGYIGYFRNLHHPPFGCGPPSRFGELDDP